MAILIQGEGTLMGLLECNGKGRFVETHMSLHLFSKREFVAKEFDCWITTHELLRSARLSKNNHHKEGE